MQTLRHEPHALDALADLLRGRRVLVLSGAGLSTESGIPDYRSPESAAKNRTPVTYQAFVRHASVRQRYWARGTVGWPAFRARRPNLGHAAVARLEAMGIVGHTITQNVDGLHQAAEGRSVTELHGALREVRCLGCGVRRSRDSLHDELLALNPGFEERAGLAPDGDADLTQAQIDGFCIAHCDGLLKPDVVFFGENVPPERVEQTWQRFAEADVLLVVGSSLAVRSGYRYVEAAVKERKPVAIVNDGPTRADGEATLKVEGRLGQVLPALIERLA